MNDSICKFIPQAKDNYSIHTTNFILERKQFAFTSLKSDPTYKMYYVTGGCGTLHNTGKKTHLSTGDIFFTFPGIPYAIESNDNFEYMYITFFGIRANMIMEKLKISPSQSHFSDCNEISEYWQRGISSHTQMLDLSAEGTLLLSLAYIGNKFHMHSATNKSATGIAQLTKKYIDDNFTKGSLVVAAIGKELSYSPKYISTAFKKCYKTGISDYINMLRIQHATTLISQGFTAIGDIALQCGFNDPQYFSKVFKKRLGISPGQYISLQKSNCVD